MAPWILPTFGYAFLLGAAGVTSALALRTITWEQLVLWVPVEDAVSSATSGFPRDGRTQGDRVDFVSRIGLHDRDRCRSLVHAATPCGESDRLAIR